MPLAADISAEVPLKSLMAFVFLIPTAVETYNATLGVLEYLSSRRVAGRLRLILVEAAITADAVLLIPLLWAVAPVLGGVGLVLALLAITTVASPHLEEMAARALRRLPSAEQPA